MAATGRESVIQLPAPEPRTRGRLIDVALPITEAETAVNGRDRIGQGVTHVPWGNTPLLTGNTDCTADYLINNTGPGADVNGATIIGNVEANDKTAAILDYEDIVVHPSFKIVDGLKCSNLSFPDDTQLNASLTQRLLQRIKTMTSAALANELMTGWAATGPSLTSTATTLTASSNMEVAGRRIEAHLATQLQGGRGMVHMAPGLVHIGIEVGWIRIIDNQLETATGHQVVCDAGYTGLVGPTAPGANQFWVFASGDISYRVSDTMLVGDGSETLVLRSNLRQRIAEALAQLAFDPTVVGATLVTVTA